MKETKELQELVISTFRIAMATALTTCSGKTWEVQPHNGDSPAPPHWVLFAFEGALQGQVALGFDSTVGAALAQALMGDNNPPGQYGDEEQAATAELLRQIGGEIAHRLHRAVGECAVTLSDSSNPPANYQTLPMALEREGFSGQVLLAVSSEIQTSRPQSSTAEDPLPHNQNLLLDVQLSGRLRFGSRRMKLRDLLQTQAGAVIELDRMVQDPVDLLVDSKLVARGEVVIVEGNYGFRVKEVITTQQRAGLIR